MFKVEKTIDGMSLSALMNTFYLSPAEARQLIADIMVALDETAKPDVTTQAYQEFDKRPSEAAVEALWVEKEIPFTTEQKMQAVIRKAEIALLDVDENQAFTVGEFQDSGDLPELKVYDPRPLIVEAPFKEIPIGTGQRGFHEWYDHYQYAVENGYIRR